MRSAPWRPVPAQGRARTAADGTYAMDLPPEQSYLIAVVDDEWAAPSLGGVVVREGVPRTGLDLTLSNAAAWSGAGSRPGRRRSRRPGGRSCSPNKDRTVPPGTFKDRQSILMAEFSRGRRDR